MNKKTFIKKFRLILTDFMQSEWRSYDPTGEDKEKVALEKGFAEGWMAAMKQLEKALTHYETHRIVDIKPPFFIKSMVDYKIHAEKDKTKDKFEYQINRKIVKPNDDNAYQTDEIKV